MKHCLRFCVLGWVLGRLLIALRRSRGSGSPLIPDWSRRERTPAVPKHRVHYLQLRSGKVGLATFIWTTKRRDIAHPTVISSKVSTRDVRWSKFVGTGKERNAFFPVSFPFPFFPVPFRAHLQVPTWHLAAAHFWRSYLPNYSTVFYAIWCCGRVLGRCV